MNNLSHNPHTYLNSYISIMRNMILTSSVSLLVYQLKYKLISFLILLFSISIGIISSYNFYNYIKYIESLGIKEPYIMYINQWYIWILFTIIYVSILLLIGINILYKQKPILKKK